MKKAIALIFVMLTLGSSFQVMAGPGRCQHDSDIAADGSRCGGRSADSRPGGGGYR
ncbi:transmembrane anchored protein [Pectobacterium versatile]|uniref:transmembrane anchored protein n=1 Tax=Pectobacterium versatile TaxID=2488639 RepID=UPI001CCDC34D|nr:transmembrane anchored protein [Pectobacterium versatile]